LKPVRSITVRRAPGTNPASGTLLARGKAYPCVLGKNGITVNKHEGDMKTPAGKFRLLFGLCRTDRLRPGQTMLPMGQIGSNDGWCDEPANANYNRPVNLPFRPSHEKMWRSDGLYDCLIVMDYNYTKRTRARGSAVFLHLTDGKPHTAGCIAVPRQTMLYLLPLLSTETILQILP